MLMMPGSQLVSTEPETGSSKYVKIYAIYLVGFKGFFQAPNFYTLGRSQVYTFFVRMEQKINVGKWLAVAKNGDRFLELF